MTNVETIMNLAASGNMLNAQAISFHLRCSHARAANIINTTYTLTQREGRAAARANLQRWLAEG